MVKLNKIYTRTGDKGTTGLADGSRRDKSDARIMAYGAVDEANATLGMVRLHTKTEELADLDAVLGRLQNDLFDLGADLATPYPPDGAEPEYPPLRIQAGQVARLESEIDDLNAGLEPLTSFTLPGGEPAAAYLHLARTTIRRAERHMAAAVLKNPEDKISPEALQYANRASDLLFVASRYVNNLTDADVLWVPGATRDDT
ncbi:MAG: cob(I)yrinic acid a,c-diamide adenosyltransferase [Parvibaculales bacterium]